MYSVHVYYYGEPTVCTQCMYIMVNLVYVLSACVYYGEPTYIFTYFLERFF